MQLEVGRFTIIVITILCWSMWTNARAEPLKLVWHSKSTSQDSLSAEFGRLYAALENLTRIQINYPTKMVERMGRPLRQILVDEHQYFGDTLPVAVDRAACLLNVEICSVPDVNYKPIWRDSKSALKIPSIGFTRIVTPEVYTARPGDSIEGIVVRDRWLLHEAPVALNVGGYAALRISTR
jgi:hypothetical protein